MEGRHMQEFSREERLKRSVERIARLSTIPDVLRRVFEVVDDERSSVSDLVKVIERDQALATKIIAMANTAFYGGGKVKNIPAAAVRLGFDMIRDLALSASVFNISKNTGLSHLRGLWQHSFEVATAAGIIARRTGLVKKEDAFLAGLVNDIGRAILYQIFGYEYELVSAPGRAGLLEREELSFGAPHPVVGAWFVERYRFPRDCILSVRFHHSTEVRLKGNNAYPIELVVCLANLIASEGKEGFEADLIPPDDISSIAKAVNLDEEAMDEVREELKGLSSVIGEFYGESPGSPGKERG
ncbi:MAG: HDOD domain-containing protein [Deltaproteobacteria bacterium]|nr:HDOD domain-containing protein [Deltaproteobacteria bacterium]